ncbi:MAG TPA: F0F1 ATP synthase subunit epsilon [Flavobacterium sp.]|nr:F0F1 ATP synthase subunit epsilon [Flavobacterium sp.]
MKLEIISPEATLFSGEVISVTVPGVNGEFQMLNNHAAIVAVLQNGKVKIETTSFTTSTSYEDRFTKEGSKHVMTIGSGTLEMKDNKAVILVD